MIDISKLTKDDVGKWVLYSKHTRKPELGKIKSWNDSFIFVVYKCAGNWNKFKDYTAALTSPKDLSFCETLGEPTKADILHKGKDYEGGKLNVNRKRRGRRTTT